MQSSRVTPPSCLLLVHSRARQPEWAPALAPTRIRASCADSDIAHRVVGCGRSRPPRRSGTATARDTGAGTVTSRVVRAGHPRRGCGAWAGTTKDYVHFSSSGAA
jgi:hypothetical protein